MNELNGAWRDEEVAKVLAGRAADVVKHYKHVRESMETLISEGRDVPSVLRTADREQKIASARFTELLEVAKALDVNDTSAWRKAENERNIERVRLGHAYRTHKDDWKWSQEFADEEKIVDMLGELDMDGCVDVRLGSVQYGSGYHVFHEIDGHHLVMVIDSQGNKHGYEVTEQESMSWRDDVEAEYSEV